MPPRPRKKFNIAWEPEWETKRMRWILTILDTKEPKLRQLLEELAPHGYRFGEFNKYRRPTVCLISITKLACLTEPGLQAEIRRVQDLCDRYELVEGLDDVDVEDPAYDDLSVN